MKELDKSTIANCKKSIDKVRNEIAKVVVGQENVVNGLLRALLANGHVLVEGIPGIAKTLLVKTLAHSVNCKFSRIQFTPDLLPTDIVGLTSYDSKKGFYVVKGPIFSNFVLADEINRAPPKVQSALLESMQEKQVTIGKQTFHLDNPFLVLATQNSIETLGAYSLPEAQIDRFLFKLLMTYPSREDEKKIIENNISIKAFEEYEIKRVMSPNEIIRLQGITKKISHTDKIKDYIVNIVNSTRNPKKYNIKTGGFIELGASPRASINLFIAAKADALLKGDAYITPQHVKDVAFDVLRHRIILNYIGQAEGANTEEVVSEILSKVPIP